MKEGRKGDVSQGMVLDAATKMMLQDKVMVANLCNAKIYNGMDVVKPEMIEPRPVEQNALVKRSDGVIVTDNRFRDLAFFVNLKDGHGFMLCIEMQGEPDWKMPLRVHEYNIREYSRLAKEPSYSRHHKVPLVVTLVLNFGKSAWKGPRSFLDLADYKDSQLAQYAERGEMVLVDPYNLDEIFVSRLCTDWKIVLCSFVASKNSGSLNKFAEEIKGVRLRRETIDFLKVYFDMDLDIIDEDETGGHINMCRAVAIMRRRSLNSGMKRGEKIGEKRGEERGEKRGEKRGILQGREEGLCLAAANALRNKMSFADVQAFTGFSLEKIASIAQSIEPSNA